MPPGRVPDGVARDNRLDHRPEELQPGDDELHTHLPRVHGRRRCRLALWHPGLGPLQLRVVAGGVPI
eukprot:1176691-Prorocentrum_minimum.AAC.5